jgi:hypothetical protein
MIKIFCDRCGEEVKEEVETAPVPNLFNAVKVSVELTNSIIVSGRMAPDRESQHICKSCLSGKMQEKEIGVKAVTVRLPYRDAIVISNK